MYDEFFTTIKLEITIEQFHQLPRNPAYKYEFFSNKAWFTPRPKYYHAILDLHTLEARDVVDAHEKVIIRRLAADDWKHLPRLFAAAFHRIVPFSTFDDQVRQECARKCLEYTRTGGDGPLIEQACFTAAEEGSPHLCGAILVTLMPDVDLTDWDGPRWQEPPPPDCIAKRLGRPHLTWIFVGPMTAGRGLGTALLAASARELLALGFAELASTFLLGNESSMLWHWRNGFRLLAYPGSWRQMRKKLQKKSRKRVERKEADRSKHA